MAGSGMSLIMSSTSFLLIPFIDLSPLAFWPSFFILATCRSAWLSSRLALTRSRKNLGLHANGIRL